MSNFSTKQEDYFRLCMRRKLSIKKMSYFFLSNKRGISINYSSSSLLFYTKKMKNLIENNIMAKSFRCIESMHNISKYHEQTPQSETDTKQNNKPNIPHKSKLYEKTPIHTQQAPMFKTTKYHKSGLKQKYHSQQVSSLYSEHIYKSMQRDYLIQAQLEKLKGMLEVEKKQKMQLLSQQKELRIKLAKLIEQNKIILFALDSMTVKLDMQTKSSKGHQLRRQTAQFLKTKFGHHESPKKKAMDVRFQATPEDVSQSGSVPAGQEEVNQIENILEKIKRNNSLRNQLEIIQNDSIKDVLQMQEQNQAKIVQMQAQINSAKIKIKDLEKKLTRLEEENLGFSKQINQLKQDVNLKTQQLDKVGVQLKANEQKYLKQYAKLQKTIIELKQNETKMINQKEISDERIKLLKSQLKFTQQQIQQRQQKQKKCINILQKFSKDLKLSDEKIKDFLKQQFADYNQQSGSDLNGSKRIYNEQLSYILHLCKKKQTLYENLVEEFKQKMRQDDFRAHILQKKLNNFSKYQEQLRSLVTNQLDKDTIFRKIMRFGH